MLSERMIVEVFVVFPDCLAVITVDVWRGGKQGQFEVAQVVRVLTPEIALLPIGLRTTGSDQFGHVVRLPIEESIEEAQTESKVVSLLNSFNNSTFFSSLLLHLGS